MKPIAPAPLRSSRRWAKPGVIVLLAFVLASCGPVARDLGTGIAREIAENGWWVKFISWARNEPKELAGSVRDDLITKGVKAQFEDNKKPPADLEIAVESIRRTCKDPENANRPYCKSPETAK